MTTITTRNGKGSPLTTAELDANFTNLNSDKADKSQVLTNVPGNAVFTDTQRPLGTGSTDAAAGNHTHTAPTWSSVTGKPSTFAPSAHSHSYLPLTGGTVTGDLELGDNVRAKFGAGDDLQIYHTGTSSVIKDIGTGDLEIQTNGSEIQLTGNAGTDYMLRAISNGAVKLYYDNATKLATTSTGVDVTGTVTATSFVGDGSGLTNLPSSGGGGGGVNMTSATTAPSSPAVGDQWYDTANGVLYVRVTDGTDAAWLDISSANGTAAAAAAGGGGGGGVVELISSTTVTSDVSSVAFTSLDLTGYSQLQIVVRGMAHDSTSYYDPVLQINGEDGYTSPAEYRYYGGNQQYYGMNLAGDGVKVGGHVNATVALISGSSTRFTTAFVEGVANRHSSTSSMAGTWSSSRAWSMYTKKEAVTSLTFQWSAQSTDITQGEFYLYGTKTS